MELKIAYGDSRLSKRWVNKKTTFDELCERFKVTRRTTETVSEYKRFTKDRRDAAKDVGGYVLGHLKGGRRKKDTVESRSGITLDADYAGSNFIDTVEMLHLLTVNISLKKSMAISSTLMRTSQNSQIGATARSGLLQAANRR